MLNDGTEAILNFVLYPVIGEKNLTQAATFLISTHVVPNLSEGNLNKEKLLAGLQDAILKTGWKSECGATAMIEDTEESIKLLLKTIMVHVQTNP